MYRSKEDYRMVQGMKLVNPELVGEQLFNLSSACEENGCIGKDMEKVLDLAMEIFLGKRTEARYVCRNGKRVVLRKKGFGLEFKIE